ncbi:MAG: SsrA-binding protein SmpB [Mycoplasma sp.]
MDMRLITTNKHAYRNYEILETIEAGIVLIGCEVKSISRANCSINEAYIDISKGEVFIVNMHVANYFEGNIQNTDPYRSRKLLLNKNEIIKLSFNIKKDRLTCIPIKIYWSKGKIKLQIALARGKKLHDKREDMKAKDDKRMMKSF